MSYSFAQLESIWEQGGGPSAVAPIMAAIALAESSGNAQAVQQGQPYGTTGWGLWQITPGNSEPGIGIDNALLDPVTNARAALAKYNSQGLGAWTTYSGGQYKQYMQSGVAPQPVSDANAATAASGGAQGRLTEMSTSPTTTNCKFNVGPLCMDTPVGLLSIAAGGIMLIVAIATMF